MQDRLKFRIFSKTAKKYIYFDNSELSIDRENMGLLFRSEHLYLGNYEELQQCTGLKDKNGTLIYEGDIVFYKIGSIKCQDVVKWSEERCGWVKGYQDLSTYKKYCEVVGNIYEHPNLLKKKGE